MAWWEPNFSSCHIPAFLDLSPGKIWSGTECYQWNEADFIQKNRVRSPESNQKTKQTPSPALVMGFPWCFLGSISYIPTVSHWQRPQNSSVFPSGQPQWGHQHSGVSNIVTPNSALGKSGRPHSQQSEHDPKQLWCPAEVLLSPQGPGLPLGDGWVYRLAPAQNFRELLPTGPWPAPRQVQENSLLPQP